MRDLFLSVLNMSLTASYIIGLVLLARLALKKAPKIFSYALWAVVLFRLLCPFTIQSPVSMVPSTQPIPPEIVETPKFYINSGVSAIDEPVNDYLGDHYFEGVARAPANFKADFFAAASAVWLAGAVILLGHSILSMLRLRRKLVGSVPLEREKGVRLADHIPSPFVLGVIRPKIYLPSDLPEGERDYILLHERTHIRRCDHLFRALAWLALAIHWFNPLVWLAFHLAGKDMEMSCDETVLRKMGRDVRADYSTSLLRLSVGKRLPAGPLAFGGGSPKSRIKNVLSYKKPALWVIVIALAAVLCAGAALATDPGYELDSPEPSPFEYHEPGPAELWFDDLSIGPESLDIQLPEFPGVTFRRTGDSVWAVTEDGQMRLIAGTILKNAYLCDLNGDGYRELCATAGYGSGIMDTRIVVYDYANQSSCELQDRGVHDYSLRLEGDRLWAAERDCWGETVLREGPLVMTESGLDIRQQAAADSTLSEDITADLAFSMLEDGMAVRITGTVDGAAVEHTLWFTPAWFELYDEESPMYPLGQLIFEMPLCGDEVVCTLDACWTDESRSAVTVTATPRALISSYAPAGNLILTVALGADGGTLLEMDGYVPKLSPNAPELVPTEAEAIAAARVAAVLLTAAEDYYTNVQSGGLER